MQKKILYHIEKKRLKKVQIVKQQKFYTEKDIEIERTGINMNKIIFSFRQDGNYNTRTN